MPISPLKKHLILACHITGVHDVNRNMTLQNDDFSLVKDWADSIADLGLQGVLFHNNFSEETCTKYQNENLIFVKVEHDSTFNPNVFRYLVYRNFLRENIAQIEGVFVTDVSDVVSVQNPFIQTLFTDNPTHIFCGDEPKPLHNEWMQDHSNHLRSKIADYAHYEENFKDATLLNCGIIGGSIGVIQEFVEKLANIHQQYNQDNKTGYTGDMGAFNYLIHTQFNDRFFHGSPINTIFKAYQNDRNDCWFRHK